MFVRTKKHPYSDKSTVLICHSHRYGPAVVQHVICKIGTSNKQYEIVEMEKIAEEELDKLKKANYNPPKDESRWDGLHGVLTNSDLPVEDIIFRYRNLWVIEESFRINKHSLKMRPIYHFSPRRILAHILICFFTFALARQAQYKLKKNNCNISIDEIRDELMEVQYSILKDRATGELYKMPSYQKICGVLDILKILTMKNLQILNKKFKA